MNRRSTPDAPCADVRDALSARLDGEDEGLPGPITDAHVDGCADCRRAHQQAMSVSRRLRFSEATPVPELTQRIVSALEADGLRARAATRRRRATLARSAVGAVGVFQVALSLPLLLGFADSTSHLVRHLGTLELALGIGMVVAALQPRRASGLLPILLVVASASLVAAIADVQAGRASMVTEAVHLTEVVALLGVWWLVRSWTRQPAARGRAVAEVS